MRTEAQGYIRHDHSALAGHFPGNPIVPGVVLLTEILTAVEQSTEWTPHHFHLHFVKFTAPLQPGEPFTMILESSSARQLSFTVMQEHTRIAWGMLAHTTDHTKQDAL